MKKYSRAHETETHFVLHDRTDGRLFHIAKRGIDKNTSDTIKSLPEMKTFKGYENDQPDNRNLPGTDGRPLKDQPQHYADGTSDIGNPPPDKQPEFPQTQEERDAESEEITRSEDEKQLEAEEEGKPFSQGGNAVATGGLVNTSMSPYTHVPVPNYDEGTEAVQQRGKALSTAIAAHDNLTPRAKVGSGMGDVKLSENIDQNYDGGGQVQPTQTPTQSAQDSMRKAFHYDEGTPNAGAPEIPQASDPAMETKIATREGAGDMGDTENNVSSDYATTQSDALKAADQAITAPSTTTQQDINAVTQDVAGAQNPTLDGNAQATAQQTLGVPPTPTQEPIPQETSKKPDTLAEKASTGGSSLDQDLAKNQADYQALVAKQQADDARFGQLVASKKLDPQRFLNNQTFTQKLMMGLALGLGGVGGGMTHTANPALEVMNNMINRDIEAQKNDQSNAINLWKMNHESLRDQQAATLQTRNQMLETAKVKMDELMGTAPGPMAMQKAAALRTQIQAEQMQNQFAISRSKMMSQLLNEQNNAGGPTGQLSQRDPASMVPYIVPPEQQKQVFQEIQDAQNITANGPKILQAFDQAVKDKSIGMPFNSLKINPASVNALHQNMLPLFKDIDGTVRQAAMDESFKNLTPGLADSSQKIAERRQALVDWISAKKAAPTAKGYGIDLSKYSSTAANVGGKISKQGGATYQTQPDGTAKKIK